MTYTKKVRQISMILSDCYKFAHRALYPEGTEIVYSTLTPRANSYFPYSDKMVSFGYEMFVDKWLVDHFNDNFFNLPLEVVLEDYKYIVVNALGEDIGSTEHIEELHKLGYLPLEIKALPEGTLVPMKVPVLTMVNTDPRFYWLTNFLETLLLSETFVTSTVATTAREFRKITESYARLTSSDLSHVPFQCHDFSERGQHGNEASLLSGVAHLTSFVGSDTIQASMVAHNYYGAQLDTEVVLKSVVASEHSVMQSYGTDEINTFKTLLTRFPEGILSLVSDTYDYWGILTEVLPDPEIKELIMAREGKLVIRPDSGDPAKVIAGIPIFDGNHKKNARIWLRDNIGNVRKFLAKTDCNEVVITHVKGDIKYYVKEDEVIEDYELTNEDIGSLGILADTIGFTVNRKGYTELDSHIGLLYGEGITIPVIKNILERMKQRRFASSNVVFGVGAYVYSVNVSRDSFGQAFKSQMVVINGEEHQIFKDPKTDENHIKRSLKGCVRVDKDKNGKYYATDGLTFEESCEPNELVTIFKDGKRTQFTTLRDIRERIRKSL